MQVLGRMFKSLTGNEVQRPNWLESVNGKNFIKVAKRLDLGSLLVEHEA